MKRNIIPTALTIAGSDSGGGAGIQADIKTFAAFDVFGTSAITSITCQNTQGVQQTHDLNPLVVDNQLQAVFDDKKPGAVKTGMLGNESIVDCVADCMRRNRVKNLVVDPVILSSSRKALLTKKGVECLKQRLLSRALLVTPNLHEAQALTGVTIKSTADRRRAAKHLLKTGVKNVLIKGGHGRGNPQDFFFNGKESFVLEAERIGTEDLHGTGCVLSSAITACLARGMKLREAIETAKTFMSSAIALGVHPGNGSGAVHPLGTLIQNNERLELLNEADRLIDELKRNRIGSLIPEVQSNLGLALRQARGWNDVVAFPGRLIKNGDEMVTVSPPRFGGSRHVANIVLTVMDVNPELRAVMNIKYTDRLLRICHKLKFKVGTFDRADEPKKITKKEGSSLEWGTARAIREMGYVPDIIYDLGGFGKEEMIRVIARDGQDLLDKVLKIHRLHSR